MTINLILAGSNPRGLQSSKDDRFHIFPVARVDHQKSGRRGNHEDHGTLNGVLAGNGVEIVEELYGSGVRSGSGAAVESARIFAEELVLRRPERSCDLFCLFDTSLNPRRIGFSGGSLSLCPDGPGEHGRTWSSMTAPDKFFCT